MEKPNALANPPRLQSVPVLAGIFAVTGGLAFAAVVGCSSDGITFNGQKAEQQYAVRKTPIIHYKLPIEDLNPATGELEIDVDKWMSYGSNGLLQSHFQKKPSPGHDLWAMDWIGCSDNPLCPIPGVPSWQYALDNYKTSGGGWPHPLVNTAAPNPTAQERVLAWTMSFQNQWFLRGIDGSTLPPAGPAAPVVYDGSSFASMPISIHSDGNLVNFSPLFQSNPAAAAQQEVGDPTTTGANGIVRVAVPCSNCVSFGYNGVGAPAGLLAIGWREAPGENIHIEQSVSMAPGSQGAMVLQGVPVPDYFGGGGPIAAGGGVFMKRFVDAWESTTMGAGSAVSTDDGVTFSYLVAVASNHLIGYGVGLSDSAFALPGITNDQEDIMNVSVIFDMTAFIAAGKRFQFVKEDLIRMQDVVSGTWQAPGPKSTLPGKLR